ncbi:hypothetical protein B9S64_10385 [Streptomyces sp. SM18]|nr:hypothetical protein B9S64_10385 [Streptomyces sp. SM18]
MTGHCSPRTRGWTLHTLLRVEAVQLLPAHAGMDPPPPICAPRAGPAPRARGGGRASTERDK